MICSWAEDERARPPDGRFGTSHSPRDLVVMERRALVAKSSTSTVAPGMIAAFVGDRSNSRPRRSGLRNAERCAGKDQDERQHHDDSYGGSQSHTDVPDLGVRRMNPRWYRAEFFQRGRDRRESESLETGRAT